jgi:hypothetical protein
MLGLYPFSVSMWNTLLTKYSRNLIFVKIVQTHCVAIISYYSQYTFYGVVRLYKLNDRLSVRVV